MILFLSFESISATRRLFSQIFYIQTYFFFFLDITYFPFDILWLNKQWLIIELLRCLLVCYIEIKCIWSFYCKCISIYFFCNKYFGSFFLLRIINAIRVLSSGGCHFLPFSVSFHKISKSWTIGSGDNLSFVFSDKENLSIFVLHKGLYQQFTWSTKQIPCQIFN